MPGQCTRSRAEGNGRSAANQCCDMKADLATIGTEATLKARRCVGPTAQERAQQHSVELKISRIRHNRKCPRTVFIPTQGTPESSIAESAQYS